MGIFSSMKRSATSSMAGRSMGGSIAGATALGVGIGLSREDISVSAMDYVDEMLTGQTNSDEVFLGRQAGLFENSIRGFNVSSLPGMGFLPNLPQMPKFRQITPQISENSKALSQGPVMNDDYALRRGLPSSRGGEPYQNVSNQGAYRRGVDGSMVFGMYNLR